MCIDMHTHNARANRCARRRSSVVEAHDALCLALTRCHHPHMHGLYARMRLLSSRSVSSSSSSRFFRTITIVPLPPASHAHHIEPCLLARLPIAAPSDRGANEPHWRSDCRSAINCPPTTFAHARIQGHTNAYMRTRARTHARTHARTNTADRGQAQKRRWRSAAQHP